VPCANARGHFGGRADLLRRNWKEIAKLDKRALSPLRALLFVCSIAHLTILYIWQ
jgi:hypothetical protein